VSVFSTERSLLKLKIIKTYLRSTMSQERLNKLVLLSIEEKMLNETSILTVRTHGAYLFYFVY